jgi:hypothetical protein
MQNPKRNRPQTPRVVDVYKAFSATTTNRKSALIVSAAPKLLIAPLILL